jgi:hypothetical protein
MDGLTVQGWLEKAVEEKAGVLFDRVRLVDKSLDIISPALEDEDITGDEIAVAPRSTAVKQKKLKNHPVKEKKRRKKEADEPKQSLTVTLKVPKSTIVGRAERVKEVDSDGDTIGEWSDDDKDRGASESSLTPMSDSPTPIAPQFAFPLQRSEHETGYLTPLVDHHYPMFEQTLAIPEVRHEGDLSIITQLPLLLPGAHPSPSGSSADSLGGSSRRRRPPPKANILRAPKHASRTPSEPRNSPPQQTQYVNDPITIWPEPSLPDTLSFTSLPAMVGQSYPAYPSYNNYMHFPTTVPLPRDPYPQYPPAYAHPPDLQPLPLVYQYQQFNIPVPHTHLVEINGLARSQNLDLLSLAAAEARPSPGSVNQMRRNNNGMQEQPSPTMARGWMGQQ